VKELQALETLQPTHPPLSSSNNTCMRATRPPASTPSSASGQVAYRLVHSLAVSSWRALSSLSSLAISATKGSLGLGSVRSELIDSSTLAMVRAGDQLSLSTSRQMAPLELMLQW
jgi:hypothetical protein